jgi:hypothetical protein
VGEGFSRFAYALVVVVAVVALFLG